MTKTIVLYFIPYPMHLKSPPVHIFVLPGNSSLMLSAVSTSSSSSEATQTFAGQVDWLLSGFVRFLGDEEAVPSCRMETIACSTTSSLASAVRSNLKVSSLLHCPELSYALLECRMRLGARASAYYGVTIGRILPSTTQNSTPQIGLFPFSLLILEKASFVDIDP